MRENLRISTFGSRPRGYGEPRITVRTIAPPCMWLASVQIAGLAAEGALADRRPGALTWETLLATLIKTGTDARQDRKLFYELARGDFALVVTELVEQFSTDSHEDWVRLVDDVTAVPFRPEGDEPTEDAVDRLDVPDQPAGILAVLSFRGT